MTPLATPPVHFDFITFALLGVTLINLVLAAIVVRASYRKENRVFAFMAASVALWVLTNALFRSTETVAITTLWARFALRGVNNGAEPACRQLKFPVSDQRNP